MKTTPKSVWRPVIVDARLKLPVGDLAAHLTRAARVLRFHLSQELPGSCLRRVQGYGPLPKVAEGVECKDVIEAVKVSRSYAA